MTDKPTLEQLQDESLLRQEIGRVLKPGPWVHSLLLDFRQSGIAKCGKCGRPYSEWEEGLDCDATDPFTGDLVIAAEQLLRKAMETEEGIGCLGNAISEALVPMSSTTWRTVHFMAWLKATPADRCRVCVIALGAVKEE